MKLENQHILIVSNEEWGDVWFSKQHYAYELSRLGYQVFFVNPTSKWNWLNIFSFQVNYTTIGYENITIVDYKNNFPQTIFKKLFTKINDFLNYIKLNKNITLNNSNLIWWQFDPFRFINKPINSLSKRIYHVVDSYNSFWQDKIIAQKSDLIVCTNTSYINRYKEYNKKTIYIPHGISSDEYLVDEKKIIAIEKEFGNYAVLVGNIENDININLIKNILDNKINLVVIGFEYIKNTEWEELKIYPNLFYLGVINAKEVNNYIAASKVGLVTYYFDKEITINSRTPLKIINYLAQNKPVISSIQTPLSVLENQAIFYAFNNKDYISCIKDAFEEKLDINQEIINNYLTSITYPKLIKNILNNI